MAAKKAAGKKTIKAPGKKPISFKPGGLHQSLGVPQGKPIPPGKMAAALRGDAGAAAQKQANMAQGLLKAGRQTAARNRSGGKRAAKGK